jgi:hypothetical protein
VSTSIDQYARDTANSASSNTVIIQAVNLTQNTNIASVNTFAGSAFDKANTADIKAQAAFNVANTAASGNMDQFARDTANTASANTVILQGVDVSQNSAITILQNVNLTQNSAINIIQGVDLTQNAAISVIQGVDLTQNAAISVIQGVNLTQNTNITSVNNYATSAYDKANTADIKAQAAFDVANTVAANTIYTQGVDATQNAAIAVIQGVDLTQNTNITSADNLARNAFGQANAAFTQANVGATFVNTGGTVSGNVTFTKDVSVTGNLYVIGNTVSVNTSSFTVQDALITLGLGNYTTDLLDIGFTGHYNDGTNAHAGFIRDASQKEFYVFQGYTPEVSATNNVDINDPSFSKANLNAQVFKGNLIGSTAVVNGLELYNYTTSSFAKANTADVKAQASFDAANTAAANTVYTQGVDLTQNTRITSADDLARSAFGQANSSAVLAQAAFDKANTGVATSTDQFARDTANTAAANTVYLSGVNATQNANIIFLTAYTQAAFNAANAGGGGGGTLDQFARDTANSKTYTFYQNTAPATSNVRDLWVNSNTGVVYENFGNTTTPIWAEFGPTPVSNSNNTVIINTLDRLSNLTSSLVLNNNGSLTFNDNTLQTTAYTGFGIDNVARTTANTANNLAQSTSVLAQAAFNTANTAVSSIIGKSIAMAIVFGG